MCAKLHYITLGTDRGFMYMRGNNLNFQSLNNISILLLGTAVAATWCLRFMFDCLPTVNLRTVVNTAPQKTAFLGI